jgi:type II secretory pathway component GspD/PulD (secretin)
MLTSLLYYWSLPMRNLANLVLVACLLSLPASAFAQNATPIDDPFGADPLGGGKTKPSAVKRPNTKQVAQPKAAATKAALKAKKVPARGSSMATLRIRAALGDETTQSFIELPLQDAVQQLSQTHDIPMVVDKRALEEIGLTPDTPVSLSLRNVSLRSFLRLMLRQLDLTYMVKDEVMQITTVETAEQNLVVEMYKFSEELTEKGDKILKALTSSVVPAAWDVKGGPCSVTGIDNVLIVSAPEEIHEEVVEFQRKLQQAFENHKAKN